MENGELVLSKKTRLWLLIVSALMIVLVQLIFIENLFWSNLLLLPLLLTITFRRSRAAYFYASGLSIVSFVLYEYHAVATDMEIPLMRWLVFLSVIWVSAYFINQAKKQKIRVEAQKNRYEKLSAQLSSKLDDEYSGEVEKQKSESTALKLAIRSGGVGIWDWDIVGNQLIWDDQMYLLYGVTKSNFDLSMQTWQQTLAEDNQGLFDRAIQDALTGSHGINLTFKIHWPDHSARFIKMLGYVVKDKNNKAVRVVGTNWDISQDKKAQAELSVYNEQLEHVVERRTTVLKKVNENLLRNEQLLEEMSSVGKIGGWTYQKENEALTLTNQIFKTMELEEERPPSFEDWMLYFAPEARGLVNKSMNNCLARKENFELELPFDTAKKNRIWVKLVGKPIMQDNSVVGVSGILQNITSEKLLKDSLIKINEKLDRELSFKTEALTASVKELETFSYTVSHDLRSPLRAIEGFSKALKENYAGILDEDGQRWLNYIVANTDKMGTLISDILTFSRVGRTEIHEEKLDMNQLVEEKFDDLKVHYLDKVLKLNVEKLPEVYGDRSLIGQIWLNLLSNALKFSSNKDEIKIEIRGKMEANKVCYTIEDEGVGFDQRYADKLFVIFQRLHGDAEFKGSGVGLAIVERILKKHGGTITATGENGKGARFDFSLPQ